MKKSSFIIVFLMVLVVPAYGDNNQKNDLRIVSIGGALTEIVYQLGAEKNLVGVDTTSTFPTSVLRLPKVGYQRALSSEGILSLSPSHVLLSDDAGPPAVLKHLKSAGVKLIYVTEPDTYLGIANKVKTIADALDLTHRAEALTKSLQDYNKRSDARLIANNKPRVVFLLDIGRGAPVAAGRETSADKVITLAGGVNVFSEHYKGFKVVNGESMIAAKPDVIAMTNRTLKSMGGVDSILKQAGLIHTPAGKMKQVVAMDGLYLLGFGPRTPTAINEFAEKIHQAIADSEVVSESKKDIQTTQLNYSYQ